MTKMKELTVIEERILKKLEELGIRQDDAVGFRTFTEAKKFIDRKQMSEISVFKLSLHLEDALGVAEGNPLKVRSIGCPAWRADNISGTSKNSYKLLRCNRSCYVMEKQGRKTKRVFCPACGYFGDFFSIKIVKM